MKLLVEVGGTESKGEKEKEGERGGGSDRGRVEGKEGRNTEDKRCLLNKR